MSSRLKSWIAPTYLLACLILGGSAQGIWQNMLLQLVGLVIIGWAALVTGNEPISGPAKTLLWLMIAAIAVVLLQTIPLPPSFWSHGIRGRIAEGYELLGRPVPSFPVAVAPYDLLDTLLRIIPPLALFCCVVRLKAFTVNGLAAALLAGTIAGVALGAAQVGGGEKSPWYLYEETNIGFGVGFFANVNHMADLLVISIPFLAATAASTRRENAQRHSAVTIVLVSILLMLLVGIGLNRSLAGYGLSLPVLAASALIVLPTGSRWRSITVGIAALSIVASVAALGTSSIGATRIGQDAATSVESREQILRTTRKAIEDFMPLGSGLGSFVKVYRLYERPDAVTTEYVIHAHNDYAELALELGIPGMVLMLLFLGWWVAAVWDVWQRRKGGPFVQAASIASGVIMVHSLVDYPLRTAAISACFAMSLALLAQRRATPSKERGALRPTRHLVVG